MADVELDYFGKRRDPLRRDEIEAVAGMNLEAGALGESGAARDTFEFGGARPQRRRR